MTSDTVPEKYRVTKVGLQHVSDRVFFGRFCGFAVVDDFFDSFEVSNGPSHPSVQWSSTRILALQIDNLSF